MYGRLSLYSDILIYLIILFIILNYLSYYYLNNIYILTQDIYASFTMLILILKPYLRHRF